MKIERIKHPGGHITYRIHSQFAHDSVATTPKEIMALLTWLQEHESQVVQDSLDDAIAGDLPTIDSKPYMCFTCEKPLSFSEAFFYEKFVYCAEHLPSYSRESEGW